MMGDCYSVLLVSSDSKIVSAIRAFLLPPMFELISLDDINEARRLVDERQFNIIIADSAEPSGTDFAIQVSEKYSAVVLLSPSELFDEISYRVEGFGVLTMTKPFEPFYFYNMIKIAIAVQYKIQMLSSQTVKLKSKMEEIRIVNRAKLVLVEKRGMSEQDAHRFLEKEAMDRGLAKRKVAERIIKDFSDV
ncbi:MAG: ANTAR domain-containing protein [Spirochaetaceae bacterium]|nr:ANTAR domain-containing protein [Spirochaetaceae bacterium]